MAINPQYQPIYNQVRQMQYKFNDYLGPNNPTAHVLHSEVHQLMNDIQLNKHPRDIENRIKVIQNEMHNVEHNGQQFMSYGHAEGMHKNFENMRRDVRHFGNYV
jgi:uncharacterized protein YPO0396